MHLLLSVYNCHYEKVGTEIIDITKQIDFDLPYGWEYIRLKNIATLTGGFTPKPEELSSVGIIPYFKVSDMNTPENYKFMVKSSLYYISDASRKTFPKGSIVFPKNGGAVLTNKKRILEQESVVDLNTGVLIPYQPLNIEYLFILFSTIDFNKHHKGSSLPTINTDFMNNIVFGLPPLAEQERIVSQVQSIMQYIDLLENNQSDYANLVETLKKAILQSAIQGILVDQNEADEPASILLERIREEKRKQLGKKYIESYIYKGDDNRYYEHIDDNDVDITEEIPYDLPKNWCWSRIQDISDSYIGLTYKPTDIVQNDGWIVLRSSNIQDGKLDLNDIVRVNVPISEKLTVKKNDIIICARNGSKKLVGKSAIVDIDLPNLTFGAFMAICKTPLYAYVAKFLLSSLFFDQLRNVCGTTTINQLTQNNFNKFLIPIPPLAEQERIVNKINEIFAHL